ncbi:MAG: hypothetical protein RRY07_01785 [Bacteroidaceae bacterium]
MKSLALYVDKWYIIGAVCTDGITRIINLPNHEDRIWLYFFEDINNDTISYGKGYKSQYYNNENHYYGDIFSKISSSGETFTMFKHSQPLREIFKSSKIFDDLRNDFGDSNECINTFISFSSDITSDARLLFRQELKYANFKIEESVARIEHLALEYAVVKNGLVDKGHFLILNANNENLHYSIYKKSDNLFVRISENTLNGMGADLRGRCLIEYLIDSINRTEHILKNKEENEVEYLRTSQFVDDWLIRLGNARPVIPIQITGITLSKDPHKQYSVAVRKQYIDKRTENIVKRLVEVIVNFVKDAKIQHEEIKGIIFLGNTFTNNLFRSSLLEFYNLDADRIISYKESDLSSLVGSYNYIDRSQFSKETVAEQLNAEDELLRKRIAEEEEEAELQARIKQDEADKINREKTESDRKFNDAVEKGYDSEREHDYDDMEDYFRIALNLRPDNEGAKKKYNDALRLKAEKSVKMKAYAEKIEQAKEAFDIKDWEIAKQKAEEALSANPDSSEAIRIKTESLSILKNSKEFERYIDRADLFIAQKAYKEALQELDKARLLGIDDDSIKERVDKIRKEKSATIDRIKSISNQIDNCCLCGNYDKAISCCEQLIELDIENKLKWSSKIADIRTREEKEKEDLKQWNILIKDIDKAQWEENWESVVSLCKNALQLRLDNNVADKLQKAEIKLSAIQRKKLFEESIASINELIVHANFKDAEQKLRNLEKNGLDSNQGLRLKETRKLLFEREQESLVAKDSSNAQDKSDSSFFENTLRKNNNNERLVVIGFNSSNNKACNPKTDRKKNADFDFNSNDKPNQPSKDKQSNKHDDDFFNENKVKVKNETKTKPSSKTTIDDFYF